MEGIARYVIIDVVLTAGLPLFLAVLLTLGSRRRLSVYDLLGDGQLCVYAAILDLASSYDLLLTKHSPVLTWLDKGIAVFTLWMLAALSILVWFGAADLRESTGTARARVSRYVTIISFGLALSTAILTGLCKYSWSLL
jgi:hypothetical protein